MSNSATTKETHEKEYHHQYYLKNKERINERNRIWRQKNMKRWLYFTRRNYQRARLTVIRHYSPDFKCQSCGCDELEILTLDHILGGGLQHRKRVGSNYAIWHWVIRNGFPDGFQILCMNCQWKKIQRKVNGVFDTNLDLLPPELVARLEKEGKVIRFEDSYLFERAYTPHPHSRTLLP